MQTLYKVDNKNKIRVWNIDTIGSSVIIEHGIIDGKMITEEYDAEPKNIGKANETTGTEQAILEAQSRYDKQLRLGYFTTIEEAQKNKDTYKPMKLDHIIDTKTGELTKYYYDLPDIVLVSRKRDGVYNTCYIEKHIIFQSRGNITYDPMLFTEMAEDLYDLIPENVYVVGELCNESKYRETDVAGALKALSENFTFYNSPDDALDKAKNNLVHSLQFVVFDIYIQGDSEFNSLPYLDRLNYARTLIYPAVNCSIIDVVKVRKEQIFDILKEFRKLGYEGAVVRDPDCTFELGKRSKKVLKLLEYDTNDYIIRDIHLSNKAQVIFEFDDFTATYNASKEEQLHYFSNKEKYIGWIASIRSKDDTKTGKPKFLKIFEITPPGLKS